MMSLAKYIGYIGIFIIAFAFQLGFCDAVYSNQKQIVGWVERIRIYPGKLKIKAKLDSGAENSSLHAIQIEEFEHNGEKWVRFDLTNWQNRTATLEKKVIRTAKIKKHDRAPGERLVIHLVIFLGNVYKEVEVNLVDRSHFKYRIYRAPFWRHPAHFWLKFVKNQQIRVVWWQVC